MEILLVVNTMTVARVMISRTATRINPSDLLAPLTMILFFLRVSDETENCTLRSELEGSE